MHITPEFAGLVAQVFPTLLIALLIEGRLGRSWHWGRWLNVIVHSVRVAAILGATASTFACLNVARAGKGDEVTDWLVNITAYLLLVATAAMAGMVMGRERTEILTDFRARKRSTVRQVNVTDANQADTLSR